MPRWIILPLALLAATAVSFVALCPSYKSVTTKISAAFQPANSEPKTSPKTSSLGSEKRPAVLLANNVAARTGDLPEGEDGEHSAEEQLLHQLVAGDTAGEPEIDVAWEERLAQKPAAVVKYFTQESATYEEQMLAYRDDVCACQSRDCVVALQDDFFAHAPRLLDKVDTAKSSEALRATLACVNALSPSSP